MSAEKLMPPGVSVIVATFRRPGLLTEAVASVLAAGSDADIIVVDDDAAHSARAEVEAFDDARVKYLAMDHPSGGKPALVRNAGARFATGRYLHFLDDDDRVAPGALAALSDVLDATPAASVAFGRVQPFGTDRELLHHNQHLFSEAVRRARFAARLRSRRALLCSMLFSNPCLTCSACMVRRETFDACHGFDPAMTPFEDADFYIHAIRRGGFAFVDRVVIEYRVGHQSLMRDMQSGRGAIVYREIYRKYAVAYGRFELLALKAVGRSILRAL